MTIKTKVIGDLSLEEAMANLAVMVSIDLKDPPSIALLPRQRLAIGKKRGTSVQWLSSEGEGPIVDVIDATYRKIYQHLSTLFAKDVLEEGGVAPLMALVSESVQIMETYLVDRMGHPLQNHLVDLGAYQDLKRFYRDWAAAQQGEDQELESVRRDRDYELFVIRKDNGSPYFEMDLLRHVKMVCGFEGGSLEEDPLLRIRTLIDKDLQASAGQILSEARAWMQKYYKLPKEVRRHGLARHLGMAILALFLAANPRNLIQNTLGKSALQYFEDFHYFLRASFHTDEYQKWITYPAHQQQESDVCMHLAHTLAHAFFFRLGGIKQEIIGLIHRMVHKGRKEGLFDEARSVGNQLLFEDQSLRTLLVEFPNGPLFKILDLIQLESLGFDPIGQENRPSRLYQLKRKGRHIDLLRMASPTRQMEIAKVDVVEEFFGFLRALEERNEKHLLINLQDRTSWKEESRSLALEALSKSAAYSTQLLVVTLPKDGDFYHQTGTALNLDRAESFFAALKKEIKQPTSPWFFPHSFGEKELFAFIDQVLVAIHVHCFRKAKTLSRPEREDFIELLNQFLILYLIDQEEPTSWSFTCKDGVDTGAVEGALFYAFVKALSGKPVQDPVQDKEEVDFLRFLFYAPALLIRERAVDSERFYRALSLWDRLNGDLAVVFQAISSSFSKDLLKTLSVLPFLHSLR